MRTLKELGWAFHRVCVEMPDWVFMAWFGGSHLLVGLALGKLIWGTA